MKLKDLSDEKKEDLVQRCLGMNKIREQKGYYPYTEKEIRDWIKNSETEIIYKILNNKY